MDKRIKRLVTPEKCLIFAQNCSNNGREDLANQAKKRAIQLKAESYGAETIAEREAIESIYAYEEFLSVKNGKKTRASRTWPMIKKYGILETIERAVNRPAEAQGYKALVDMGLEDYAFEAIVRRYPHLFSEDVLNISQKRLTEWANK
jgi:hypothetical protein